MKNSINRYFIAAIVAIVAVTWGISLVILYLSNQNTQSINNSVSVWNEKTEKLQRSVDELSIDVDIKREIINMQDDEIKLKDSLLDMSELKYNKLSGRFAFTQAQLQQTRKEVRQYAKVIDSLRYTDTLQLDRFKLNGNSPK